MIASELIANLQELVKEHGDLEVFSNSSDGCVSSISIDEHGDPIFLIE